MVAEYNKAAAEAAFGPDRMKGYQHDVLSAPSTTSLPSGVLAPFDIIVTSMALHHVADPGRLLRAFSELLKPGGVCVVVDMVPASAVHEGNEERSGSDIRDVLQPEQREVFNTIGKHGFNEEEMRALYAGAGMWTGFEYVVFGEPFRFTMFGERFRTTGFIARGEKSAV
jgi:SAM-dependent methyltransferase